LVDRMLYWGNKRNFKGVFKFSGGVFGTIGNLFRKKTIEMRMRQGKKIQVCEEIQNLKNKK
ncbi:MAG: hypothetical protein K2J13_04460, partial [Clostridia bacterium]|nr:hypothetical protein [Clostridia bacterium]